MGKASTEMGILARVTSRNCRWTMIPTEPKSQPSPSHLDGPIPNTPGSASQRSLYLLTASAYAFPTALRFFSRASSAALRFSSRAFSAASLSCKIDGLSASGPREFDRAPKGEPSSGIGEKSGKIATGTPPTDAGILLLSDFEKSSSTYTQISSPPLFDVTDSTLRTPGRFIHSPAYFTTVAEAAAFETAPHGWFRTVSEPLLHRYLGA